MPVGRKEVFITFRLDRNILIIQITGFYSLLQPGPHFALLGCFKLEALFQQQKVTVKMYKVGSFIAYIFFENYRRANVFKIVYYNF